MTRKELAEKIATFKFKSLDDAHDALMKACETFGLDLAKTRKKGMLVLYRNPGAWKETKKRIRFEPDFLKRLDAATLYGIALYLYDLDDVLEPWKYYKKAFETLLNEFGSKIKNDDKLKAYNMRKQDRKDSSLIGKWRKRRAERLDAKWITVGATPEDKEAGIPAGKGRHVLIDDEGEVISGAGGSLTGIKLSKAKSTSEDVKVDPAKVGTAAIGEGKSMSGSEPVGKTKETDTPKEPDSAIKSEDPKESKLRIVSSGSEFAKALGEAATKEDRQAVLDKMPAGTTVRLGEDTYRKKTNGEWVLNGHKAPKDIAGFEDKNWGEAKVQTTVEKFKNSIDGNAPEYIEDMLKNYAVGTIIKLRKDGDMALERKLSGWIVTSGGFDYGLRLPTGASEISDLESWKNLAESMDNWYVKRKKDTVETKDPSDELIEKFEEENDKEEKDFYDTMKECEVGTEISADGINYKKIAFDKWERDDADGYDEYDDYSISDVLNNASSLYVGGKLIGEAKKYAEGRKAAKAEWSKYTTPEYIKSIPSLKNYEKKVESYRKTSFKAFTDAEIKEANDIIGKIFRKAEYCARFPEQVIDSIIEKGLLNQFETGTTHGFKDSGHDIRYKASQKLFGTKLKESDEWVDGKDFEKYGFMSEYDELMAGNDGASSYGNCCLIFERNAVKDRVTCTGSDSLSLNHEPGRAGEPPTLWGLLRRGKEYTEHEKNEIMTKIRNAKSIADLRKIATAWPHYMEAQYHGKMPISTVKEIVIGKSTKMSEASRKKLEQYGIKVTIKDIGGSKYTGY